jgi:hypothetical protein
VRGGAAGNRSGNRIGHGHEKGKLVGDGDGDVPFLARDGEVMVVMMARDRAAAAADAATAANGDDTGNIANNANNDGSGSVDDYGNFVNETDARPASEIDNACGVVFRKKLTIKRRANDSFPYVPVLYVVSTPHAAPPRRHRQRRHEREREVVALLQRKLSPLGTPQVGCVRVDISDCAAQVAAAASAASHRHAHATSSYVVRLPHSAPPLPVAVAGDGGDGGGELFHLVVRATLKTESTTSLVAKEVEKASAAEMAATQRYEEMTPVERMIHSGAQPATAKRVFADGGDDDDDDDDGGVDDDNSAAVAESLRAAGDDSGGDDDAAVESEDITLRETAQCPQCNGDVKYSDRQPEVLCGQCWTVFDPVAIAAAAATAAAANKGKSGSSKKAGGDGEGHLPTGGLHRGNTHLDSPPYDSGSGSRRRSRTTRIEEQGDLLRTTKTYSAIINVKCEGLPRRSRLKRESGGLRSAFRVVPISVSSTQRAHTKDTRTATSPICLF